MRLLHRKQRKGAKVYVSSIFSMYQIPKNFKSVKIEVRRNFPFLLIANLELLEHKTDI